MHYFARPSACHLEQFYRPLSSTPPGIRKDALCYSRWYQRRAECSASSDQAEVKERYPINMDIYGAS
jgi:hypothetical protein